MNLADMSLLYKCLLLLGTSTIVFSLLIVIFVKVFTKLKLLDHPEKYPHEN